MPAQRTAPRPVTPIGIAAAELAEAIERLEADGAQTHGLRRAHALVAGLDPYVERCTSPESPALRALAERTRAEEWEGTLEQEMLSGHVEGRTLRALVQLTRARRVLEVGMFTGYSALAMAEALPEDGELVACELDPRAAQIAREGFDASPHGAKIRIELGPAAETLSRLTERFDLVFIDADKAGYLGYLEQSLGLLAPGGVVAVDNTLMQGQPWTTTRTDNGDAIAAFNDAVAEDARLEQVLLPLRDGLTLIRRV